ncbi:hypothetical protein [Demequina sp.]|uniref:hypothetical protein n=1 Tax=Demequina sp. TaxID=2050685 RepID=UPI0025BD17BA|nr:hypothetical protein [Demequina sp.]
MWHLDDEIIAGVATGESLDAEHARRLAECARFAASLGEFEQLAARAGSMGRPAPLLVPPARVWDAVVAELATDDARQYGSTPEFAPQRQVQRPAEGLATVTPIRRFSGWLVASASWRPLTMSW